MFADTKANGFINLTQVRRMTLVGRGANMHTRIEYMDGQREEAKGNLLAEAGTIVPAPPGLILLAWYNIEPYETDDEPVEIEESTIIAFRVSVNGDTTAPITPEGVYEADGDHWGVLMPTGRVVGPWGRVASRAELEQNLKDQRARRVAAGGQA